MNILKKEERKFNVLGHVVSEFVSTAAPVSSKLVARRMGGKISSATVRNIMAELEEQGYIEQPHTSAGRIPTHNGYRQYVDAVVDKIRVEKREAERLAKEYTRRIRTMKEVIERTSYLLSRELHNAGIVMWPSVEDFYLKHMELVKVRAETVLAVMVTMTNAVKNYVVRLDRELRKPELERVANFINSNYESANFSRISEDLRQTLKTRQVGQEEEIVGLAGNALRVIDTIMEDNIENEICWDGLDYFMENREFRDLDVTKRILHIFSERRDLMRLMRRELPYGGLKTYIGEECSSEMLRDCSLITCGYTLRDRAVGRIGIIGPTRMDYERALRTVSCLARVISTKLEEIDS